MDDYMARLVDHMLANKLKGKGAVLIQGPKWCGKTKKRVHKALVFVWWSVRGSNPRPPGCDPGALPAELTDQT